MVIATVLGEFTVANFKEFEKHILKQLRNEGKPSLMLDLSSILDYTIDVAWEEIKFSRAHSHDFKKIAVVTESQWLVWSAWISRSFVDAEIVVFDDDSETLDWLSETAN